MTDDVNPIETGLVGLTAAVTEPAPEPPPQVPAVIPVQVPAAMPEGWSLTKVAVLVRDVAQNMYDLPYILKKHTLSAEQYATLKDNQFFQSALAQMTMEWNSAANTQKRLALEAAIAVEDALPTVAARLSKPTEPLADVVSLLKVLSEIAGTIGSKAAQSPAAIGEKFKIVINLGGDLVEREAHASLKVITGAEEGTRENSGGQIQKLIEGADVLPHKT